MLPLRWLKTSNVMRYEASGIMPHLFLSLAA
jgi:hypothetical protein